MLATLLLSTSGKAGMFSSDWCLAVGHAGWFTAAAWEKINNRLQKRFKLLVLGTTSQGKTQPPAEQEQELLGLEDGAAPPAAADNGSAPMDVDH